MTSASVGPGSVRDGLYFERLKRNGGFLYFHARRAMSWPDVTDVCVACQLRSITPFACENRVSV